MCRQIVPSVVILCLSNPVFKIWCQRVWVWICRELCLVVIRVDIWRIFNQLLPHVVMYIVYQRLLRERFFGVFELVNNVMCNSFENDIMVFYLCIQVVLNLDIFSHFVIEIVFGTWLYFIKGSNLIDEIVIKAYFLHDCIKKFLFFKFISHVSVVRDQLLSWHELFNFGSLLKYIPSC